MNWDTIWSAMSALASVVGIFLAVLLFNLDRDKKELTIETVSTAILVDLSDPGLASMKLTYRDVAISRLAVATIEIRNSGTRPIERADFELPILLRFKNPTDVLAVTLNDKKTPQDLKPVINSDDSGISVAPLLLNPGDEFRITVQLRGDFDEPTVESRISGVSSISRRLLDTSDSRWRGIIIITFGLLITLIYLYFGAVFVNPFVLRQYVVPLSMPEAVIVAIALGVGGAGMAVLGITGLELFDTEWRYWGAIFGIIAVLVIIPITVWRRSLLRATE